MRRVIVGIKGITILSVVSSLAACGGGSSSGGSPYLSDGQTTGVLKERAANLRSYTIKGITYYPEDNPDYDKEGVASWYGEDFHGKKTANGETYDMEAMTAAHKTLMIPSFVEVTNLENGKKAIVKVNDRGPFIDDREIDLSKGVARKLGSLNKGLTRVRVKAVEPPEGITIVKLDGTVIKGGGHPWNENDSPRTPAPIMVASNTPVSRPTSSGMKPINSPVIAKNQSQKYVVPQERYAQLGIQGESSPTYNQNNYNQNTYNVASISPSSRPSAGGIMSHDLPPISHPSVREEIMGKPTPNKNTFVYNSSSPVQTVRPVSPSKGVQVATAERTIAPSPFQSKNYTPMELDSGYVYIDDSSPNQMSSSQSGQEISASEQGYSIMIGAFSDGNNVDKIRKQLSGVGKVKISAITIGDKSLQRVVLGQYESRGQAETALQRVKGIGLQDARIVDNTLE